MLVAPLGTCSHAREQLAVREGWCHQRNERLCRGSALLRSGVMCAELLPCPGWPRDHVPPPAPGQGQQLEEPARKGIAAFPKSGMQSHPPEWKFMVKAPFAMDGGNCEGRVIRNELLPLERRLLLSGKSQQRVINHQAGQSCLLRDGVGL